MRLVKIIPALALALTMPAAAFAATDGIQQLITVTQMKADNANEEALQGAEKQRELVAEQKRLRAQQRALEKKLRGTTIKKTDLPPCPSCVITAPVAATPSADDDKKD